MRKYIIAAALTMGLAIAPAVAQAQNVAPVPPTGTVTLPITAMCMPIPTFLGFANESRYVNLFNGELNLVREDGPPRRANDGARTSIYYNPVNKSLINVIWNGPKNIACITHTSENTEVDEVAWRKVGNVVDWKDDTGDE